MGSQRGLDANHSNVNANRREDAIHANLLVPTLCRADLGWIFYFGPAKFRKIAGEFLSEFWWWILIANFSALFFRGFRPPKKIHAQNSRPELSAFLSNFTFSNPKFIHADFLLTGETKIWPSTSKIGVFCESIRANLRNVGVRMAWSQLKP